MELRGIQAITFGVSLAGVILCVVWSVSFPSKWRYIAPVVIAFIHTAIYYGALFITETPTETPWSLVWGAAHRFHMVVTLVLYPLMMPPWKRKLIEDSESGHATWNCWHVPPFSRFMVELRAKLLQWTQAFRRFYSRLCRLLSASTRSGVNGESNKPK